MPDCRQNEASGFAVVVRHDAPQGIFDNQEQAQAFADALNAVVHEWLPWSQFASGPFAEVEGHQVEPSLDGLPRELSLLLRDQSIVVPADRAVFDLLESWRDAPSNTASGKKARP